VASIFEANITNIGLLGPDLGADVIKVLSKADNKQHTATMENPMPHSVVYALHAGRFEFLSKWRSDLYHVAMRIRAFGRRMIERSTVLWVPQPSHLTSKK
jgi:hypothetical protein